MKKATRLITMALVFALLVCAMMLTVGAADGTEGAGSDGVNSTSETAHTVTYNMHGTVVTTDYSSGAAYVTYNPSVPFYNEGGKSYGFKGWSLTEGGAIVTTFPATVSEDLTYYAVYAEGAFVKVAANGAVTHYPAGSTLSSIAASEQYGETLYLLTNASVNALSTFNTKFTIDLNGYTLTGGAQLLAAQGKACDLTIKNGKVAQAGANHFIYYWDYKTTDVGDPAVSFENVEITQLNTAKSFAELRFGTINLDNVRFGSGVTHSQNFINAASDLFEANAVLTVNIKNTTANFGGKSMVWAQTSKAMGYTLKVNIENSDLSSSSILITSFDQSTAKAKSAVQVNVDSKSKISGEPCVWTANDNNVAASYLNFAEGAQYHYLKTFVSPATLKVATPDNSIRALNRDGYYTVLDKSDVAYTVTLANGTVNYFTSDMLFSTVLAKTAAGSVVDAYVDATLDAGKTVNYKLTIDMHGNKFITVAGTKRIGVGSTTDITFKNAKFVIHNDSEVVHIYNADAKVTVIDCEVVEADRYFMELRAGTLILDNLSVAEAAQGERLIAAVYRTAGRADLTVKNSTINLKNSLITGTPEYNEVNGFKTVINVINSTITTTSDDYLFNFNGRGANQKTENDVTTDYPGCAENCSVAMFIDANSRLNAKNIIRLGNQLLAGRSVVIEEGAKFSTQPVLTDVTVTLGDGNALWAYNTDETCYTVAAEADLYAKLTDAEGNFVIGFASGALDKTVGTLIANGTLTLYKDMYVPAGIDTSNQGAMSPVLNNCVVDLNKHLLEMRINSRFNISGTSEIKNGSLTYVWNISILWANPIHLKLTDLDITNKGNNMAIDLRQGNVTMTRCNLSFVGTVNQVFDIANASAALDANNYINFNLIDCVIDASQSENTHIFYFNRGDRNTKLNATGCTFKVKGGCIIGTKNSRNMPSTVEVGFENCTLDKINAGNAFSVIEDYNGLFTVNLSETVIKATSYGNTAGTFNIAKGETEAVIKSGGFKITKPLVTPKANLTLYADFNLNLWLPVDQGVTEIKVGDVIYKVADLESAEGMYKVVVGGIAANAAADDVTFYISYQEGEEVYTVTLNYSVVKYAASLLANTTASAESKALVASAVDYIGAAYTYAGTVAPEALTALMASENYTAAKADASHDEVAEVPATETNKGNIAAAISSAQLSLGSNLKLVLNLNASYTGALTLTYAGNTYTYTVEAGKVENATYVELDMRAYDLYDEVVTIVAGEHQGSYDLKAYAASDKVNENANLEALVLALYNFCKEADEYKAIVNA